MRGTKPLLACLLAGLVVASATGPVSAQEATEPETPEEFVTALNDLRGSEALAAYPELDLARSQAVVEIQTSDSFTDDDRRRMGHLLNALEAFQRAYANASSNPVQSVETADGAYNSLTKLEAAGGDSYSALGFVAVERFYGTQGERLYQSAQNASSTSEELRLLDAAVHAYERSGNAQRYSEIRLERDELRAEYEQDVERHDELTAQAAGFLETCEAACESPRSLVSGSPLSTFSTYADALSAHDAATSAAAISNEHGLGAQSDAPGQRETAFTALRNAAIASVGLVVGYALAMVGLGYAIVWRLSDWAEDAQAAAADRIVTPQEVENA
jgi:hypothetical protein